ncbi:AraC family transcriptional regulator [Nonomuraea sp. NPDC049421]|uniref:AraC family transcriptional regulator n=1 Tax=Nonomuraea sp. NPDC049421 TaxID=3155275 RepID=UPI00343A66D7
MGAVDSAHYWRHPGLGGLDLMHARFVRHRFGRHSHETYAIGVVEQGEEEIRFADGVERAGPGGVVLIEPGVVHTGQARTPDGWTYRVLYPGVEQMRAAAAELGGGAGTPSFSRRIVADPRLARQVAAAHRAARPGGAADADLRLHALLVRLLAAYGASGRTRRERTDQRALERARDLLHAGLPCPPPLTELATSVGLTPFGLVRSFRARYGMPPHAYVTHLRVTRARTLLAAGLPPAEVAQLVGFCDQSHLSRHFRRLVGVPPRAYQRAITSNPRLPGSS